MRQAIKWWKSANWVSGNAENRIELGDDFRQNQAPFSWRYRAEVTKVREMVNEMFGTDFGDSEIVQVIKFTIRRQRGAHANFTLAKSFPDLQAWISQAIEICVVPRLETIEIARPVMGKALKAYQAVIGEAAARGDGARVWDQLGKFTGWVWEIQGRLESKEEN